MSLKLAAIVTIGAAVAASFGVATRGIQGRIGKLGEALKDLEKRRDAALKKVESARVVHGKHGEYGYRMALKELNVLERQVKVLKSKHERMSRRHELYTAEKERTRAHAGAVGAIVSAAATVVSPVVFAAESEQAFLGVAKQLDGARDSSGKLTSEFYDMRKRVLEMGREVPIATNEIADMVTAGLRMGVPKEKVLDYVKTVAMMSTALELPAEQAADSMGKIGNIFGIQVQNIGDLADAINYLDDNSQSTGAGIIDVLQRIGGVAAQLSMPAKDAAALASTFLSLGRSAEVASTATNAVLQKLAAGNDIKAVKTGLESLGLDAKKIQADMQKDATGTLLKVLDALKDKSPEERMSIALKMFGAEYSDDVALLVGKTDELRRQLELANSEKAKGSMAREYQAQLGSTIAQWQILKNSAGEILVQIGSHLLPGVNALIRIFRGAANGIADFFGLIGNGVRGIGAVVGTLLGLAVAAKTAATALSGLQVLRAGIGLAAAANPIFTLISVLGAFVAAVYVNWDSILGAVKENIPWLGEMLEKLAGWLSETIDVVLSMGGDLAPSMSMLAAPVAILGVLGVKLQTLGSKFVSLGKLVMGHPLLLAVGLLATAAFLVYKNWEPIKAFFADLWDGIVETVGGGVDRFLGSVIWLWEEVKSGASGAFDWLMARVAGAVDFAASIGQAITGVFDTVKRAIMGAIDWVMEKIEAVREKIVGVLDGVKNAKDAVTDAVGGAVDKATGFVGRAWDGMKWLGNEAASAVGMGSGSVPAPPAAPAVPAMASARAPQTVNAQQTNTIHITQALGQDNKQLVDELMRRIKELQAVQARGANFDQAMAY